MSDHLPECDAHASFGCICPALRACEQRVREQYATDWQTEQESIHLAGLNLAYRRGVAAARDAVAALSHDTYCYDHDCRMQRVSLAAIDALGNNSSNVGTIVPADSQPYSGQWHRDLYGDDA